MIRVHNFHATRASVEIPETFVSKHKMSTKRIGLPTTGASLFQLPDGRLFARVNPGVWRAVNATHRTIGPVFAASFRGARPVK